MRTIKEQLKDLPDKPGVYIMRAENGQILYVGKARSLVKRVKQYFSGGAKAEKVMIMVSKIAYFDYIITRNEIEALVMENNLIKKNQPPYNILLKDDKNYPYLRIDVKAPFPRVTVVRKLKKDGAKYFGPYMLGISAREMLELIYAGFPLSTCKLNFNKIPSSHRPCLNYHIKRCLAPCAGSATREEYAKVVGGVIRFLSGSDKSLKNSLQEKMNRASAEEDYELALEYRDKLKVLEKLIRTQVSALPKEIDIDVFAIATNGMHTVVSILMVRAGKILGADKYVVNNISLTLESCLSNFIVGYYSDAPRVNEVLTNLPLEDADVVSEYLSESAGRKVKVQCPKLQARGRLVEMCSSNAGDYLEKSLSFKERQENMTLGAVIQLQETLGSRRFLRRIECYDISNISGTDKVSSMVVFINGAPYKKHYRKFKIKTVEGSNDFACMHETLTRRFNRYKEGADESFREMPDLVIVDGGKGQLSYAITALTETRTEVDVVGLAEREEEIFTPLSSEPIVLDRSSYALRLMQRIRDEAHRFCLTHHRTLRAKRQTHSRLSDIPGIGKSRVKLLLNGFGSISAVKNAGIEELTALKGMSKSAAQSVIDYFKNN